jgi:cytochrome c oxidase accessory protein FixG
VLFDIGGRRFYFFALEIWPQEIYFLTGLLILAALGLFLGTSLFGRVCTCPQTVWTDLFMWVERLVEGDRRERMRLDREGVSRNRVVRKVIKHSLWLAIAMLTGGALVMYFNDAPTVVRRIVTGDAGGAVYLFFGLFTATTYLLAGWARELVCTSMCPWPRIQGGLLDKDTLVVTYRDWRGEPRGPHKKGTSWVGRGDCIDCFQCLAVCPTGVDIRAGMQLDCIGCGLCIDACNDVMAKVGRPSFLIAWDSARNDERRAAGLSPLWRLLRPRTLLYGGLFAAIGLLMLGLLLGRQVASLEVLHDSTPLFVRLSDGSIRNGYNVKIRNTGHAATRFELALADAEAARYRLMGDAADHATPPVVTAAPGAITTVRLWVSLPEAAVPEPSQPIVLEARDLGSGEVARARSIFRGPG